MADRTQAMSASPRGRASLITLIVALILTAAVVIATGGSGVARAADVSTPGPAFDCDPGEDFLSQGGPTQLYYETDTGGGATYNPLGTTSSGYNALGYDTVDNYLFATSAVSSPSAGSTDIVQIDADGNENFIGQVTLTGLGAGGGTGNEPNSGAFEPSSGADPGDFYLTNTGDSYIWVVNPTTATLIKTINLSTPWVPSDWAFSGGYLFGAVVGSSPGTVDIYEVNPANGTTYGPFTVPGQAADTAGSPFGAAWTYGNGNLGFDANETGDIDEYSVQNVGPNATFSLVQAYSTGLKSGNNDGAACPGPDVDLKIAKLAATTYNGSAQSGTNVDSDESGKITYTLTVTNNSSTVTASGYGVSDPVPSGVTNVATTTAGCSVSGNTVSCNGGQLKPGKSDTITITGTAPSTAETFPNTATLTPQQEEASGDGPLTATATVTTEAPTPPTPKADLSITKSITSPTGGTVDAGQTVSYSVGVTNSGPDSASAVTLSDPLPKATTLDGSVSYVGNGVSVIGCMATSTSCTIGTMPSGSSVTATYTLNVSSSFSPGMLPNTATSTTTTDNSNNPNSTDTNGTWSVSATASIAVVAKADLSITKSITAPTGGTVEPGQTVAYSVTETNTGPSDAQAVNLTDPLPSGTSLDGSVTWSDSTGGTLVSACPTTSTTCQIATLPAGDSVTETYTLLVSSAYTPGTLTNTAFATTFTDDSKNPSSTTGTVNGVEYWSVQASASINVVAPKADLSIVKSITSPTGGTVDAGQDVSYSVVVTNTGPDPARAVALTDPFPTGTSLTNSTSVTYSASGGASVMACPLISTSCTIGTMPSGSSVTVTYTLTVASSFSPGTLANTATATTTTDDSNNPNSTDSNGTWSVSSTASISVVARADLSITKSITSPTTGEVPAGDTVTYSVTESNTVGPSDAQAVQLDDSVPSGTTLDGAVTWTDSTGGSLVGGVCPSTSTTCQIATLPAGDSVTETFTVLVGADYTPGTLTNTAFATTFTDDSQNPNSTTSTAPGGQTYWIVSAQAQIPVIAEAQLTLAKSVLSPAGGTVTAGNQISYRLTVGNSGPSSAQNAKVIDPLPASLDPSSATVSITKQPVGNTGSCSIAGATVSCSLGTLPVGSDLVEVTVTATVLASDTGSSITNTATATTTTPDNPTGAPNQPVTGTSTENEIQQAKLTIAKVVTSPSQSPTATPVIAGNAATYTITVGNTGPSDAQNADVTDTLPSQFEPSTAVATITKQPAGNSGSCSVDPTSGAVSCSLGTLPVGSDLVEITITVTVNPADTSASIANQACTTTTTPDNPNGVPNATVCATATLTEIQRQLVTSIKAASSTSVVAGDQIGYTITVANQGPSNAADSVVSDPLPTSLDPSTAVVKITKQPAGNSGSCSVDASTGVLTCSLGSLPVGSDLVEISVTATVLASDTGSSITNTACTTTTTPDANTGMTGMKYCGTSTIQELQESALTVTKTVTSPVPPAAVIAGDQVTYQITVGNTGPSYAQNAAVSDSLPASLDPASATVSIVSQPAGNTGSCAVSASSGVISCALGTLPVGSGLVVISVTATVKASDTGSSITNQACASTTTPDPTSGTTGTTYCGTATVGEIQQDNLAIQKVATTSPGVPGSDETYQLQVTNTGPSDAQGVKVTDPLPAGTSFVSASSGCTATAGTVTCTDADLPAAAGADVIAWNVTVLIDSAQTGSSTNTATVTSTTPDGNPDNMAKVTIPLSALADLSVRKTADQPSVAVGSDEGYTLTVTNHGPSDATDVVVTDPLPTGLKFVSASKGCTDKGQTVTCTDPVLSGKAGENVVTFHLTVYVEPTVSASIINTATVTTKTPQSIPAGATPGGVPATRRSTAHATAKFPVLKVTNTPNKRTVPNGGDVTYTLKLTNTGKGTAFGVKLCDRLPAGATVVKAAGAHLMDGELCWTLPKLAVGKTAVRTKTLKMASKTLTGKVPDPATGTAINTKPAKATALVTVGPAPGPTPEGVTG